MPFVGDTEAFVLLGSQYHKGSYGLPQDKRNTLKLYLQAAKLGSVEAHFRIASAYFNGHGVGKDNEKAIQHWRIAAIRGNEIARHILGIEEGNKGRRKQAMKHFMIAAKAGFDLSLKEVGEGYKR